MSVTRTAKESSIVRGLSAKAWFRPTDADVLLVYVLALFAAGGIQHFLWTYSDSALQAFRSRSLFEVNVGEFFAFVAIYSLIKGKSGDIALTKIDFFTLSAGAMFFLPPEPLHLPFIGATIVGIYLWRRRPYSPQLASVGQLLLAVSAYEIWGPLFFRLVSAPIIQLEVALIAKAGQLLGFGLETDGILLRSPSGWSVFIMDACSSFHNVSLAVLVWLSLLKLARVEPKRWQLAALALGVIAIIGLNALRILLMTPSEEGYVFWHEGAGAILFSCLTLAAVAVPTTVSLARNGK